MTEAREDQRFSGSLMWGEGAPAEAGYYLGLPQSRMAER